MWDTKSKSATSICVGFVLDDEDETEVLQTTIPVIPIIGDFVILGTSAGDRWYQVRSVTHIFSEDKYSFALIKVRFIKESFDE